MEQVLANNLYDLGAKWIAREVSSLCLVPSPDMAETSISFLGAISASETIVRGCLFFNEMENNGKHLAETRLSELLYGARSLSFPKLPSLIQENLGISTIDFSSHKEVLLLRKALLFSTNVDFHHLQCRMLQFLFEVIDPLMFKFREEIIFLYLPEIDGLEERISRYLDQIGVKQQLHE